MGSGRPRRPCAAAGLVGEITHGGVPPRAAPGVRDGVADSCTLFAVVEAGGERWLELCEFDRRKRRGG